MDPAPIAGPTDLAPDPGLLLIFESTQAIAIDSPQRASCELSAVKEIGDMYVCIYIYISLSLFRFDSPIRWIYSHDTCKYIYIINIYIYRDICTYIHLTPQ